MKHRITAALTFVGLLATFPVAGAARAQYTPSARGGSSQGIPAMRSPVVSPYINLLNGNGTSGSAAINYFGIVRPQLQSQLFQQGTSQQLLRLESEYDPNAASRRFSAQDEWMDQAEWDRFHRGGGGQRGGAQAASEGPGQGRYFFNYSHYYADTKRR